MKGIFGLGSSVEQQGHELNPEINPGHQGKHQPGSPTFEPERSELGEDIDPGDLVGGAIEGEYEQVGETSRGVPVYDFEKTIGTGARSGKEIPYGAIYFGKKGSHVIPANPELYGPDDTEGGDQEEGEEEGIRDNE